jgi:hypothetical protein
LFSLGRRSVRIRAFLILAVCVLALSFGDAVHVGAQMSGTSQDTASIRLKPHSIHIPQHGGVFFMALDNEHHLEGVLLKSGVFKVYLYDAFTRPLPAAEVQRASANVQVGESESAPRMPLVVGKDGRTLQAAMSKDLKLPVTITLSLRFLETGPNVRPEVFTFPFSHYIAADAHPQQPVPMDTRLLILFVYFCIFLGDGVGILIVRDRMVMQADRRLPGDGKIRNAMWSKSRLKRGEIFRLWRVHRRFFPHSSLRFSYMALWVLTLSWLFFGLNLLQR